MSVGAVNKNTGERIPTAGMPAIDNALSATSTNPVQNAIITAALANKQDKTDNALQTTDKTVVGAINEHEGDIGSLKSGLTNVTTQIKGLNSVWKMTQNNAGDLTFTTEDNRFTGFLLITGNNGKYAIYTVNVSVQGGTNIVKLIGNDYTITYSNKTLTVTLDANWSKATLITDTVFS